MMKEIRNIETVNNFRKFLVNEEKCKNTTVKYVNEAIKFFDFCDSKTINKELVIKYKNLLITNYAPASANCSIAALNTFFRFMGWNDLKIKSIKIQREVFCSKEKELTRSEYKSLVFAANASKNERLSLILQTLCGTGVRVSELEFITVEAVKKGVAVVSCKGKMRKIFIVSKLRKKLMFYAKKHNILNGKIFITNSGKTVDRSNVWREMKKLCEAANVNPKKIYPHNLRHLFARIFYSIEKDIAKLADVLGHSSINTTRIYIVTTGEEHKRYMESMKLII